MTRPQHVAFVGFGEAATAFVSGWAAQRPAVISVFDIKTKQPAQRKVMEERYIAHGVSSHPDLASALRGADAIFSLVTADQAVAAAQAATGAPLAGAFWFDCNSCAPDAKRQAASAIEDAGGRYVDVAVMAPVHPKKHHVPLLVSGPHAEEGLAVLQALDMKPRLAGAEVGRASSIKMLRSVMIKGMEALVAECFLSARRAGVDEEVIASLESSDPDIAWRKRGAYALGRMMEHGARRAAEMHEVTKTVENLGLDGRMSSASAGWQDEIGALAEEPGEDDLADLSDRLLARLLS